MAHSFENIEKLIREYSLEKIKDYIYKNLRKCIQLSITMEEYYKIIGSSRVGCFSDVPSDFISPEAKDGELMTFVAQLNMKELSLQDMETIPRQKAKLKTFKCSWKSLHIPR